MKALSELNIPNDRTYTDEHIWAKQDGDTFLLGISDFAQDQLGEIVYIELPSKGDSFKKDADFGTVESVKSVNKLFMPFDGEIVDVNMELEDMPTIPNGDCYTKGWIVRIKASNPTTLLSADEYKKVLAK